MCVSFFLSSDLRLCGRNVLKNSIPPPPPLPKFYSPDDSIMLEDESGRIQLVGKRAIDARLVTGVIIAALGIETPTGEFEVVDICYAEMAPQPIRNVEHEQEKMDVDGIDDLFFLG